MTQNSEKYSHKFVNIKVFCYIMKKKINKYNSYGSVFRNDPHTATI